MLLSTHKKGKKHVRRMSRQAVGVRSIPPESAIRCPLAHDGPPAVDLGAIGSGVISEEVGEREGGWGDSFVPESVLPTIQVSASADASSEGLSPVYPGGQMARGGRAGILGTRDALETPFSINSYTAELIQNQQAESVGDVLQNDAAVRMGRGYGNFQETYFIRGLSSVLTTLPTMASTACFPGNTSPPNCSSASKSCVARAPS